MLDRKDHNDPDGRQHVEQVWVILTGTSQATMVGLTDSGGARGAPGMDLSPGS